jgi:hypothetical protein
VSGHLAQVDVGLLADQVGETAADTLDLNLQKIVDIKTYKCSLEITKEIDLQEFYRTQH